MKKLLLLSISMLISTLSWGQLTGITLAGGNLISTAGGNFDISTSISNSGTLAGVNWSVSNSSLATFTGTSTSYATINAKRDGIVTVTAVAFNATSTVTGRLVITITNQISSLSIVGSPTISVSNTNNKSLLTVNGNLSTINPSTVDWIITPNLLAFVASGTFNLQVIGNGKFTVTAMSKTDNTVLSNTITVTSSGFVPLASSSVTAASNTISTFRGKLRLTTNYAPANATLPVLSWMSSDNCIASVSGDPADVAGKRNGIVTITGTWSNGGSATTNAFVVTVSGQKVYHESFQGIWDSNTYFMPSTYDPRTSIAAMNSTYIVTVNGFPEVGVPYYPFKNTPAVNQLDYSVNNSNTVFETDGTFFSGGVKKLAIYLEGNAPYNGGCGIDVSQSKTVDRKSTRLNSSHSTLSRMPSSA